MSSRRTLSSSLPAPPPPTFSSAAAPFLAPFFLSSFASLSDFFDSFFGDPFLSASFLAAASGSAASVIFLWSSLLPLSLASASAPMALATGPSLPGFSFFSRMSSCVMSSTAPALTFGSEILVSLVNNEGSCFGTATFTVDVDHHGVLTAPLGQLASATANLDVLAAFGFIDL
jgi:hypothetical protein